MCDSSKQVDSIQLFRQSLINLFKVKSITLKMSIRYGAAYVSTLIFA